MMTGAHFLFAPAISAWVGKFEQAQVKTSPACCFFLYFFISFRALSFAFLPLFKLGIIEQKSAVTVNLLSTEIVDQISD